MSPNPADRAPSFWLNVTTSFQWNRSPVGIVRTEQEILRQLGDKLQHRLRTIVFQDGEFLPETAITEGRIGTANIWPEPSYGSSTDPFDPLQSPRIASPSVAKPSVHPKFRHGDVLISLGLDWEHPGLHDKIRELKRRHGLIVVTCCYDLIPVLYPQYCVGDVSSWFKNYLIEMSWLSDGILCISENTRRDYLNFAKEVGLPERRAEVFKLGSSLPKRKENEEPSAQVRELLESRFFLFVSTIERRKNHEVLYRAYHLIRVQFPELKLPKLVFVGMKGWGVDELMSDIQLDPLLKDEIVVLPRVSDSELWQLYQQCEAFLFPSLYEGWGLPVAEALQFGKPVIASDTGSISEVGGDLVHYVDPWSPRDWARELLEIIEGKADLAKWSARIAREFKPYDWSSAADTLIAMAVELRSERPSELLLEPGYDLSSLNGTHYGDKIIYEGTTGIVCHGPYVGAPAGKHLIRIGFTWLGGATGYLRFIASHNAGQSRAAVKRVEVKSLKPGTHMIELMLDLSDDITDLEVVCEAHSEDRVKFSLDSVRISLNAAQSGIADRPPTAELTQIGA